MTSGKPGGASGERGEPVRQRVLDAAERLLRSGKAEFSMRDLAAEAGVSFATPFNQFGSKAGIMHALSARRIETMSARLAAAPRPADARRRLRLAVETAVAVMLEEPDVNRAVMGSIGAAGPAPATALARSAAYWALALANDGAEAPRRPEESDLPRLLAFAFRGALSFWSAGELSDAALGPAAVAIADRLALGFTGR
ncbi:TetR/AcrR family transcriptional regulator [Sphingomonas morindae]|uniref:TetR/AcrR family transcriptional regulator n=1 Tax=Sphingomonas morindae TaxID=1541170 RepID=A0ABY4X9K2_9SPHN|nr:TetR/AcrR family transcriptional regulator [Sphingomonas morindae]USI73489.1 TetR/AcrR family transcriptional regulator [Sphingomonas morindae]